MAHFIGKLREDWLIELPEEARQLVTPGQLVEFDLPDVQVSYVPSNLADFLGDVVGSVEGSGANNSDDTGHKFADHVVAKHRENLL